MSGVQSQPGVGAAGAPTGPGGVVTLLPLELVDKGEYIPRPTVSWKFPGKK